MSVLLFPPVYQAFQDGQAPAPEAAWMQRMRQWVTAVEKHEPATADDYAKSFARWSQRDLTAVLQDFRALRRDLAAAYRHNVQSSKPPVIDYLGRELTISEVLELMGLTDDEGRRGDASRILKRGALLHTDIALFVSVDDRPIAGRSVVVQLQDGQQEGVHYSMAHHWQFARSLLDGVTPDPSKDDNVLLWYRATAAYLQAAIDLGTARPLLEEGRRLFPDSAEIAFYSGCVAEAYTAPRLRAGMASIVPPPGRRVQIRQPRAYLQDAEAFFRKALQIDPDFTEARVRLGRVVSQLGRHGEAADELRKAQTTSGETLVRYYAAMLLGAEEQALGRHESARERYELAASIYPTAQSPLFALGELALRRGDREGARLAIEKIVRLPAIEADRIDPWISYYYSGGRRARELLAEWIGTFQEGGASVSPAPAAPAFRLVPAAVGVQARALRLSPPAFRLPPVAQGQPTFSTRVEAVRVDVLVTENGKPLTGLRASDFEVRDNGVVQRIDLVNLEKLPVDVVLAFDVSTSVSGTRLGQLRSAGNVLLDDLKSGDRAALITFSHVVQLRSGPTGELPAVRAALENAQAGGETALADGCYLALAVGGTDTGRRLLIVFSDGLDTASWLQAEAVVEAARRSQAVVYAVSATGSREPPSFLRGLCAATGGRLFEIESTWNLSSLFVEILDEFRQRYLLSYQPGGVPAGGWHVLDVRVKGHKSAVVQARSGYFGS